MAVDTRQAAEEYKRTADYVRRLCEGEEVEGLPALTETSRSAMRSAGAQAGDAAPLPRTPTRTPTRAPTRARRNGVRPEAHDACDACGQPGQFICCERCPRVYHFMCVEPPMTKEMVGQIDHWYCRVCAHQRSKKRKSRAHAKNIMFPLISNVEYSNPRAFVVPDEIRRLFDGVEADIDGAYMNVREDRAQRAQMGPANRDFLRLTDDHNEPIMCYRCGLSALHGPVVRCDYCPLNWHWDCLDPPLSSAPPPRRRWMCPNHADHAMRRHHKFRKERIVDQTAAPEAARNSGIVDIIDDDPPWHEICDPKVRYRITSSRIREQFSRHALPATVPPACHSDSGQTAAPRGEPPLTTAEWLQSIVAFQQDVARFVVESDPHADKFAVLSSVAAQILEPEIARGPVLESAPSDDEQADASALVEPPQVDDSPQADEQPSPQQVEMLSEHGLSVDDIEAALDRIVAGKPYEDAADAKRSQVRHQHGELPRPTTKRLRLTISSAANSNALKPNIDKAAVAARARASKASAMVTGLLKAKGTGALLNFLLND
ncbi:hypothetical protein H4R23_000202 [Coemansia sp. Cherry 401B]|nr:hypothetical protein IWW54_001433 [Coemansia sp. RSA 2705]KAJ2739800.1 hypothetical protein H4R23_000202 [Coemansia sp. Cherry 401B]